MLFKSDSVNKEVTKFISDQVAFNNSTSSFISTQADFNKITVSANENTSGVIVALRDFARETQVSLQEVYNIILGIQKHHYDQLESLTTEVKRLTDILQGIDNAKEEASSPLVK